jgi:hypothetical protein
MLFYWNLEFLNKLKEYSYYTLLPSHELQIRGVESIEKEIDNRGAYFYETVDIT